MARSKQKSSKKPAVNASWGGRFSEPTDAAVARFSASVGFDSRLWRHDIQGSMAHALMLGKQGIIRREEAAQLVEGLGKVAREIETGGFAWKDALEDVHMNIEARLRELLGPVAGKLHTARSRNDQVATDVRLYLRDQLDAMRGEVRALQAGLVELAGAHVETVMPGFTHMQPAQPISLAHHLLAWFEMLERDHERLGDVRKRLSSLPLGAGALAGTTFPIDREMVARQLGFDRICENSLDAVADRDFAVELAAACALVMTHLSRMSEELVLWASPIFGFVDLPDAFCTGSSIMPQKKNPDVPELVRGKAGRVFGALTALLTLMKGLPLAYNRDMQEDKEPIFDAVATTRACLDLFARLVPGMRFRTERMAAAARDGYSTATDLADYLVVKGVPFREAHEIVGRTVRGLIAAGKRLDEASARELRAFDPRIGDDVVRVLTVEASVTARKARGGTAFPTVKRALAAARRRMRARSR